LVVVLRELNSLDQAAHFGHERFGVVNFRALHGLRVETLKSLNLQNNIFKALDSCRHVVDFIFVNDHIGEHLSKLGIRVCIGEEAHVQQSNTVVEVVDRHLLESHIVWILDFLLALIWLIFTEWVPELAGLTNH